MTFVDGRFIELQQALIGTYSLERELGRGGMGIVFLARDVALDRPVAIKLLPPAMAAQPALRERFLREARTAAKLSHPNIVPIHAVEETTGLVYFVMSYVEGESLGERLRTRGPLTPHEAARMLQEVAWALGYAHGRGVVHRDIKPDNLMLERGTGRAIVMDFGIAAAGDADAGEVVGTAQYVSPEQANGEPVDGRSDIYSLGVVGFLALSGRLPFDAPDVAGLLAMHITKTPPPLASVAASVPGRLARTMDRCLAKNPADRFPTGEALAEAIAQTVEAKRELPVALRLWLKKGGELRGPFLVWYIWLGPTAAMLVGMAASRVFGPIPGFLVGAAGYVGLPLAIAGGHRAWHLRRLLAAGYGLEDARLAVRDAAEKRREELAYEFGAAPPLWARIVYRATIALGLTSVAGFVGIILAAGAASGPLAFLTGLTVITGLGAVGGVVLNQIRPGKPVTKDLAAERRLKFWNSRFGNWLERLARIGLRRTSTPAELTYRPTELALGLAAGSLFDSLSKAQRRELKELPALIARLERDAALMRRTVDELGSAVASLGDDAIAARSRALQDPAASADGALAESRSRLREDLVRRRDQSAQRLAAAVTALENIRLSLLRLKAGTGTVSELTADLSAAQRVEDALAFAAAARQEVETLLAPPAQPRA